MIKGLLKLWWLFLIIGILAGIAGIFYASQQKIKYKSRLTFALDDGDQNGIGSFLNLASQFGINGSGKDIFAGGQYYRYNEKPPYDRKSSSFS